MDQKGCTISGIIKHNGGVGFKVTFTDVLLAQKYKDMLYYIIRSDDIPTLVHSGYYDDKERYE